MSEATYQQSHSRAFKHGWRYYSTRSRWFKRPGEDVRKVSFTVMQRANVRKLLIINPETGEVGVTYA